MKRKRCSEELIAFVLRQHDSGIPVAENIRKSNTAAFGSA